MRESGNKNGFTQVDHISFDIVIPLLSLSAQSVYLRIYRQTMGWHKQGDYIANSQFRKKTGIKSDKTIRESVRELAKSNLVIVDAVNGISELRKYLDSLSAADWRTKNYGINLDTLLVYERLKEFLE